MKAWTTYFDVSLRWPKWHLHLRQRRRCFIHYRQFSFFGWWRSFIYIPNLVRFACICNKVSDFNECNLVITEKNIYTKGTAFINYWKHSQNFITVIKILYKDTILHEDIWSKGYFSPMFYGDVMNKFKKKS